MTIPKRKARTAGVVGEFPTRIRAAPESASELFLALAAFALAGSPLALVDGEVLEKLEQHGLAYPEQADTDRLVDVISAIEVLRPLPRAAVLFACAGSALGGCSGDHDLLARRDVDAAAPVDVSIADVRSDERRVVPPPADVLDASDAMDQSEPPEPPEPPGRWSFTWLNGLVDVESVRLCFVPTVGDREMRDQAVGPAGLLFGKSIAFSEFGGIDLSTMDVHPYAVVGGLGAGSDGGQTCTSILDAPDGAAGDDGAAREPIVVRLPLIPAGTLAEGRSYLGVVTGCARVWPYADAEAGSDVRDASDAGNDADGPGDASQARDGGDAAVAAPDASDSAADVDATSADATGIDVFRPPSRAAICGASTGDPNTGLVLVRLSRRDVGASFGFQAVHASAAVAAARVTIERTGGSMPALSADIGPYQIVPRDGLIAVPQEDFGPTVGSATLRVASSASTFPTVTVSFASALAASDIIEAGLALGDRFSLVLIGAQPGQYPGPPWNAARVAVIRNAPFTLGN